MKTHTSSFKEQIKLIGKEIDSRITFGETVLGKDDLNAVTPSYQGAILKSVMKQLDIDSNVEIPVGTILKYEFGLKVNGEYEYINYGNYVVYSIEKQEDTNSYKITCYDKLLYSMLDYVKLPITYPISIRDYIGTLSMALGLNFANNNDEFANYDKQIQSDLYDGLGYTFRDILDELAQVTASTICLNNNDELEIRYITETNDVIDEEFLKDVNVNFGEKFGPVNTIVLSRSADSDSIYYPETLPSNPYEIKISDNQIMNGNDRADFLPDIYNKLNGLEFYTNDFVSTGIVYYDLCDRYSVKVGDNTYSCVMFNDEVLVTQGLEENVYTELPEQTETDYKHASKDDRMINQVYIIAKKNEAEILALVSTTENIQKEINPTKDESGSEIVIEDASDNPLTYLEIEGKSTQKTRSGKNLIPFINQNFTLKNINYYVNDGSLYLNGTSTGETSSISQDFKNNFSFNLKAGTYYISHKIGISAVYLYTSNNESIITLGRNVNKNTFTLANDTTVYIGFYQYQASYDNVNTEIMISSNDGTYEPYGTIPSPAYPSEIKSVGYENLLDYTKVENTSNTTATLIDNGFNVRGLYAGKVVVDNLKPNTNYYLQYITEHITGTYKNVTIFPSSSTSTKIKELTNGIGGTFNTGENTSIQIWFYVELGNTTREANFTNIILSEKKHNYIPHGKYGIEIETTGRNKWDEQWELGSIYNGDLSNNSTSIRSKNFCKCLSNTDYYLKCGTYDSRYYLSIVWYDENENFISSTYSANQITTSPNNAKYFKICTNTSTYIYGNTYNNDICINISDNKNGEYTPYQKNTSVMELDAPLRSLPNGVKDIAYIKNNRLYVDRYVGSVIFDGSESWLFRMDYLFDNYAIFRNGSYNGTNYKLITSGSGLSNYFNVVPVGVEENNIRFLDTPGYGPQITISKSIASTENELKTWLSTHNTEVIYELATPVTEELGEIEMSSTFKGYNNITTTDDLEPIINLTYVKDTVIADYVEQHVAELKINEDQIRQSVETVNSSVDGLTTDISRVEQITTDNSQVLNIISTNIDKTTGEVREVTTTTGFTFNAQGMEISDSSGFKGQHTAQGTFYKDGETIVGQYTKDGSKQKDLELFGTYSYGKTDIDDTPMFVGQLYTDENGEECFGHFYNGGDY